MPSNEFAEDIQPLVRDATSNRLAQTILGEADNREDGLDIPSVHLDH